MKRMLLSNRSINTAGVGVCAASLLIAIFYMERILNLPPCPLCILSRYVVVAMFILFFLGLIDNGKYVKQVAYTVVNVVLAVIGIAVAGRHLWIQNHPSLSCSLGSSSASVIHFITSAFAGSTDCTLKSWEFLGMSIPEQTLVLFGGLLALLIFQLYSCLKSH